MTTKAINGHEDTALTLPPCAPTASESLKVLSRKVTALTTTYFTLCQQQYNLASDQDEDSLFQAVIQLSVEEVQLGAELGAFVSKEDLSHIRTESQLNNKKEEKVAADLNLVTTYQAYKQLETLRTPKLPPQLNLAQPRFTIPALQASNDTDLLAAEAATFEFKQCIATPNVDPTIKITFANQMNQAIDKIKDNNTPRVQLIKAEKYKLLQTVFAPKIADEIVADFEKRLKIDIAPSIAKIAKKCNSLPEYIAAKRQEDKVIEDIAKLKDEFAHELNLEPSSLQFNFLDHKLDTELTSCLETVTRKFSLEQEERAAKQLILVDQNYKATEEGGGGNCLFHSLVGSAGLVFDKTLLANGEPHQILRENLVFHMSANRARFEPLINKRFKEEDIVVREQIAQGSHGAGNVFENYLEWISKLGNWGGNPEIQAMSDLAGQPIVVVQEAFGGRQMNIVQPETIKTANILLIKNWGSTHFQSLKPKKPLRSQKTLRS